MVMCGAQFWPTSARRPRRRALVKIAHDTLFVEGIDVKIVNA